jgi:hypothetical protein
MAASGNFHTDRNLTVQRTQALSDGYDYSLQPAFWFVGRAPTGTGIQLLEVLPYQNQFHIR